MRDGNIRFSADDRQRIRARPAWHVKAFGVRSLSFLNRSSSSISGDSSSKDGMRDSKSLGCVLSSRQTPNAERFSDVPRRNASTILRAASDVPILRQKVWMPRTEGSKLHPNTVKFVHAFVRITDFTDQSCDY